MWRCSRLGCVALCFALRPGAVCGQAAEAAAQEGTCQLPGGGSGSGAACVDKGKRNGTVDWDRFERDGFIVIPGVLNRLQILRAKEAFRRSADATDNIGQFRQEGSLLELDPVFAQFLESLPKEVEAKMASILGPWIVGGYAQITLHPLPKYARPKNPEGMKKARAQGLHSDFPYGHSGHGWGCRYMHGVDECLTTVPPQYPRTLQLIFMLDDFTEQNGGTLLLPGSHKHRTLPSARKEARTVFGEKAINTVGKAGDLVMYVGFMWHSSGVNIDTKERAAVIVQCLPYYFKPMHSHSYRLPNRVARSMSPKMRNRLGLTGYSWFKHTGQLGNGQPQPLRHGALLLWDALRYGYPTRHNQPLRCRNYALGALAAPLLLTLRCRWWEAFKLLVVVSVGLVLGVCLALEKFQM